MISFVYRSLVLGLLGAAVLLAAALRGEVASATTVPGRAGDAVVDVSRAAAGDSVLALLGLAPGERVVAIADQPATTEDVPDRWRAIPTGGYLDLTIAEPAGGARRVLVLAHP